MITSCINVIIKQIKFHSVAGVELFFGVSIRKYATLAPAQNKRSPLYELLSLLYELRVYILVVI